MQNARRRIKKRKLITSSRKKANDAKKARTDKESKAHEKKAWKR